MRQDETHPVKRSYIRHPFSERKWVVDLYESGLGSKRIAQETGLDDSMVRQWLRCYRSFGLDALVPMRGDARKNASSIRNAARARKDQRYDEAFRVFATTLEPIASIARRYQLEYRNFKYHIEHHHPELVAKRTALRKMTFNL